MSLKSFGKEVINAYSQGKPVLRAYSNGKLAYRQQQEIIYSAKVKSGTPYFNIDGTTLNLPINGVVNSIQGHSLYVVPQGDTQHSAIPAPVGGACWCRVTNRYYNVLQNNGVGELEYEPISVNKNPRTEYSLGAAGSDYFEVPLTMPIGTQAKVKAKFTSFPQYTTLVRAYLHAQPDQLGVNLYIENGTKVVVQRNSQKHEADFNFGLNQEYTFALTPTGLLIDGVKVVTYPQRSFQVDLLDIYCSANVVYTSSFLVYNTNPIAELIPVPQSDVQYSDIPAPAGGALWDRVTNKYYAKQGTGTLKFTPLPRLTLVSTGTQWINTGIAGNTITLASIRHEITDKTKRQLHGGNSGGGYFGANNTYYEFNGSLPLQNNLKYVTLTQYATDQYNYFFNGVNLNLPYQLNANPLSWYWLTLSNVSAFAVSANTTNAFIYVGNTLTQNLIPVKQGDTFYKKDSTPAPSNCMYDTVTDTYFENAGTGTFGITYEH